MRFYTEAGRFAKKKEIAKEIPLTEVENIFLEEKELSLEWKNSTQRFVFDNDGQAKNMFESANDFLNQSKSQPIEAPNALMAPEQRPETSLPEPEAPPEPKAASQTAKTIPKVLEPTVQTTEAVASEPAISQEQTEVCVPQTQVPIQPKTPEPTKTRAPETEAEVAPQAEEIITAPPPVPKEEHDAGRILTALYPIVDSLFDILRNLSGKADWSSIENYVENIDDKARQVDQNLTNSKLDVSPLMDAAKQESAGRALKETYNMLLKVNETLSESISKTIEPSQIQLQSETAKTILHLYYVLNDIILATAVGDPAVEQEITQLATMLDSLVKSTNCQLDSKVIVATLSSAKAETGTRQSIEETRALFKNQVESLLSPVKSSQ